MIAATTGGRDARVDLDQLREALYLTYRNSARWTVFQCIENHDLLDVNHTGNDRQPRIAALADPSDARSWYARSRAKVATGILLTAPGVPMIFMGQEFLEDKYWTDWPKRPGAADLVGGSRRQGQAHVGSAPLHARPDVAAPTTSRAARRRPQRVSRPTIENRVIAFHRWLPDLGRDVVVVASLNESTFYNHSYRSASPTAATGTKSSTATSTISGSTRTRRAILAASPPTDQAGMVCRPRPALRCRRTACWCSQRSDA